MRDQCVVVTNPMIAANKSSEVTLSKFLRVISDEYQRMIVIGGNITLENDLKKVRVYSFSIDRAKSKGKRIADIGLLQFKMATQLKRVVKSNTPVYFWVGDKMIFPYFAAKHKKADVRYFVYGNVLKEGSTSLFKRVSGKLIAYMANHADWVCVESPHILKEWSGLIRNKNIKRIHLYTEINKCDSLPERENVIGMLCRLTAGKHVIESILAFCQVHSLHPEYRLEIIGSGRQEKECRDFIRSMKAEEYIEMIGWVEHDQIIEKTSKWKYLLFPSDTEGMPNSVLEMMGQGIPAIASPVGGVIDIISHGETGWLLSEPSVSEIKNALMQAIENPCYREISQNARCIIANEYSLSGAKRAASESC